jgi:hypothetical protein
MPGPPLQARALLPALPAARAPLAQPAVHIRQE